MRFVSATHDKPASEYALLSNKSNINNETAQHRRPAGESELLNWTYAGIMLDLRWTYAGPTLDLRWTYAGLRWTYAGPTLDSRCLRWTYAGHAGLMLDLRWTYAGPTLDLRRRYVGTSVKPSLLINSENQN